MCAVRHAVTKWHELVVKETDPRLLQGGVEAVCWGGKLWEGGRRLGWRVQSCQIKQRRPSCEKKIPDALFQTAMLKTKTTEIYRYFCIEPLCSVSFPVLSASHPPACFCAFKVLLPFTISPFTCCLYRLMTWVRLSLACRISAVERNENIFFSVFTLLIYACLSCWSRDQNTVYSKLKKVRKCSIIWVFEICCGGAQVKKGY